MGAFGEKLRKQREQRGLALDAISNTTKISTRMLRALEDEHFDQLPGGVFNKGFVRAYARQVGLDEEETVTDYLTALRESQVQSQQILPDFRTPGGKPRPATPHDDRHHILPASEHPGGDARNKVNPDLPVAERRKQDRRSQNRQGNKNGGEAAREDVRQAAAARTHAGKEHDHQGNPSPLLDSQLERRQGDRSNADRQQDAASVSGFITFGSETESSSEPVSTRGPSVSRITLAAAILIVTVGVAVWTSHRRRESASTSASASTSPASPISAQAPPTTTLASATPSAAKPAVAKSPAATSPPSAKTSVTTSAPRSSANPAPATTSVPKIAAPAPVPTFTLLIRAEQTTWVSIIADGKPVSHETLIAPAHTSVRATHDVTIRVGNAAGVSFLLNGKEFPAEGNVGEAKTFAFDANGPKAVAQTPPQAPVR